MPRPFSATLPSTVSFPLLVLHLSDLHFGPHGRFAGQDGERLAARFAAAIDAAREEQGIRQGVGLVVVTGDIAEAARKNEYEAALAFFGHLDTHLRVPRDRFVFVPGNHDVSWAETRKVQIEQEDEGFDAAELERRLEKVRLARFEAFAAAFHGRPRAELPNVTSIGHGAVVHHFAMPGGGIAVAALNSCERESHIRQGGSFGEAQAQALLDHLRGLPPSWKSILAVHHNPITPVPEAVESWVQWLRGQAAVKPETIEHFAADAAGFEGKERLRAVTEDARVSVVLHGHHHGADAHAFPFRRGEKGHTLVLSSGSWGLVAGQLPESQPAMVHMLELDPAQRQARSILRIYAPRARAEGHVEPGTFAVDPASPRGATLDLYVPRGFGEEKKPAASFDAVDAGAFVEAYRRRFGARYVRWDLGGVGVTQPSGGGPPVEARLDEMFVPPRLGTNTDPSRLDDGAPLDPFALVTREAPLVLRGPAGCGKTTLLRHCFRKLLAEGGRTCVPFLIELRELGRAWERAAPSERTLEAYLAARLAEVRGRDERATLAALFDAPTGPRPILLVDGWDELGDLGDEVREKLMGLLSASPRVLAVVTSRPYGESRPSSAEGFDVLDVQPLSDEEIAAFAARFHGRAHGEDEAAARVASERFVLALASSAEAQALARTALLLVMMLFVHRSRPLPDKRHELYRVCLDNLLSARPRAKEVEGARAPSAMFRPEDAAERMRGVAELAHRMQEHGYQEQGRSAIVRTEEELCDLLPRRYSSEQRRGFIAWLVSAAGVLVDRADGTFSFAHLSFQEYLVAHHWAAVLEGHAARREVCRRHLRQLAFWETLRLWAAIVEDRNPEHLEALLADLMGDFNADGFWLAGVMFADGLGEGLFEAWVARLPERFHVHEQVRAFAAARAWATSQQEGRRQRLAAAWPEIAARTRWLPGVIASGWWQEARLAREEAEPPAMSRLLSAAGEGQGVARGRALGGSSPVWPGDPPELSLLHLWPGPRGPAAARLQTLVSLGGGRGHLGRAARKVLVPEREERDLARQMARSLARSWAKEAAHDDWVRTWALDLARDWAMDLSRSWAREWTRDFALDLARYWARYLARYWTRDLARDWAFDLSRYWARDWAQDWVFDMAMAWADELELPEEPWTLDFVAVELAGIGRAGTRAVLAFSEPKDPLLRLFHEACRLSLRPRSDGAPFRRALAELAGGIDPLWPALARHVARLSTPEDRALLRDLATHPERREKPLSWGLRYYVRGDLVLDDGTEVELDALCDEAGIERLPLLAPMPDELEVEFD